MKRVFVGGIGLLLWSLGTAQPVDAQAGDVGSAECRAVQQAAQTAVSSGGPYKNHGKLVSTAAKVVGAAEGAGTITDSCAGCIVSQFARRIPIEEQLFCGPHCGDGVTQSSLGEACDDGDTEDNDGCSSTCQIETDTCGDGVCEGTEDEFNCAADCGCAAPSESCASNDITPGGCYCDAACLEYGDCCPDACSECGACGDVCGNGVCGNFETDDNCAEDCGCAAPGQTCDYFDAAPNGCYCDAECVGFGDCCADACSVCGRC